MSSKIQTSFNVFSLNSYKISTDTNDKEIEFMNVGGDAYYLYKPFEEGVILETVRKALSGMSGTAAKELIHELRVHQIELAGVNKQLQKEITERKKMEEALLKSEKLKSLGIITAGISHEFNNILNIISGNIQLLQMDYKDHSKLMDSLSTIKASIDDGSSITERMREFTYADTDTMNFVPADINEVLTQSVEFTMPLMQCRMVAVFHLERGVRMILYL